MARKSISKWHAGFIGFVLGASTVAVLSTTSTMHTNFAKICTICEDYSRIPTDAIENFSNSSDESGSTLEDLMYKYGSDKSKDDHGYTNFYKMLLDPIRQDIRKVAEVGVSAGQSLQAWWRYFPNAELHGIDIQVHDFVRENLEKLGERIKLHQTDLLQPNFHLERDLEFQNESMDLIIDDGPHTPESQEAFLQKLFPAVRPGGYYVIEDVGIDSLSKFHENPDLLQPATTDILEGNDVVLVETAAGHRAWKHWMAINRKVWVKDHVQHNSYLMVIRKREQPPRPVQIHFRSRAMRPDGIVTE